MRRMRVAPGLTVLALAGLFAGCSDKGPVGPDPAKNVLRILLSSRPFEEQTIGVGATLQLSAQLFDAAGKEVAGTTVDWRSTDAAVARVSPTGLVEGVSVGSALVIASAGAHADTARVNVATPLGGAAACAPGEAGLGLGVGEVHVTTGDKLNSLCLQTGSTGAEYALIPFNASEVAGASMSVSITGTGVDRTVTGPPTPNRIAATVLTATGLAPRLQLDDRFHLRRLQGSRRALEPRLKAASRTGLTPTTPSFATAPKSGDLMKLNVEVDHGDGCQNPDYRTGRVAAVTGKAIVVVDTANPKTGLSAAAETDLYRSFGMSFDTLVWRVDTRNFGEPSDIDKNGRVVIFYTRAVNEQTPASNTDSYVGGYFYNRDLFAKTGPSACPGSNYAEMFYMLAPDPSGDVNGHARSVAFIRNTTVGVLAHEFQHLINDSRRLHVNKAPVWEESWLNEGLSHIAEELIFYEASGLRPRQNIGPNALSGTIANQAFAQFQSPNVDRLIRFLQNPETNTLMGADELATRGAVWSFLRYAADRDVGSDTTLWNRLVKDPRAQGLQNLRNALGVDPRGWMQDWAVATYTDDAGLPLASTDRFTHPSWDFRALLPRLAVGGNPLGRYPLKTLSLSATAPANVTLKGGGAAYVRFRVPAGSPAAVRATVGGLPAPSLLKVAVVRTK